MLFVTLGAVFGSWAVRIPDIAHTAEVDSATLGLALLVLALGSLLGMPASGIVLSRFSLRVAAGVFAGLLAIAVTIVSASNSPLFLFVAVFGLGLANGIYGVVINTAASHLEHDVGRALLSSCHAAFSVATLISSVIGGLAVGAKIAPLPHIAAVAVVIGIPSLYCARYVERAPRPERYRLPRPRSKVVWIASAVAFTALFAEGAVTDWSAYFLQSAVLNGPDARQGWGYSFFAIAMAIGRGAGGKLIDRLGERAVLLTCTVLAPLGYLLAVTSTTLATALAGFAIIGLGLSNIYPSMISLAARGMPPHERQDAVASVSSIGYFGFLLGPSVIGGLAGVFPLRAALAAPIAILLVGAAGTLALLSRNRSSVMARSTGDHD